MWAWYTNVTDKRTDGQTTCNRNTAFCTTVHRAVKKKFTLKWKKRFIHLWSYAMLCRPLAAAGLVCTVVYVTLALATQNKKKDLQRKTILPPVLTIYSTAIIAWHVTATLSVVSPPATTRRHCQAESKQRGKLCICVCLLPTYCQAVFIRTQLSAAWKLHVRMHNLLNTYQPVHVQRSLLAKPAVYTIIRSSCFQLGLRCSTVHKSGPERHTSKYLHLTISQFI